MGPRKSDEPDRRRTVGILIYDDVEVLDFAGPFEVFCSAEYEGQPADSPRLFEVVTIAEEARPVRCSGGLMVHPDHTVYDHPPLDIMVVPGGSGSRRELHNRSLVAWIAEQNRRTEITMSVCNGAPLLAESGVLDGLQATTHRDWIDWMAERYPAVAVLNNVRLVDTGHVVTSAGISAGIDLALHLVERLHGAHTAAWTARGMEHLWSEQYRNVFESSADAIVIVNRDGHIALTNSTACALFGYAPDGMGNMHVTAIAPPELREEVIAHFKGVPPVGSTEMRSTGQRRDGTRFHAELHSSTFEYHGVPHVLSMIRDITARVEAEEAVLEERQRLSRELHDSVSQALYGIVLGAQTARSMVERDPTQVIAPLDYVVSLAQTGLAEMRALIFALRPEALEQEGLLAALSKQAAALEARHQVRLEMSLGEEPLVPLPLKEALYRIAQEAIQNAIKHAKATAISLSLVNADGELVLEVRDDGVGFDTGASFPGHLGLLSMRERAAQFGGVLELKSGAGMGTSITTRVALAKKGTVAAAVRG